MTEAELTQNVIFLDRDGVINLDSPCYIKRWDEYIFLPNSLDAIRLLTLAGYSLILITNQSIINRKWVHPEVLADIHLRLKNAVESHGGKITDIFFCPHTPDEGCCCRKPEPGLIRQACDKYAIELSKTVMVGDSAKDILCGKAAGCGRTVLVQTGNGRTACDILSKKGVYPDAVVSDLLDAAHWIMS